MVSSPRRIISIIVITISLLTAKYVDAIKWKWHPPNNNNEIVAENKESLRTNPEEAGDEKGDEGDEEKAPEGSSEHTEDPAKEAEESDKLDKAEAEAAKPEEKLFVDVPKEELWALLSHDYDRYKPSEFKYFNAQNWHHPAKRTSEYSDRCLDDYIICTADQIHPRTICSQNKPAGLLSKSQWTSLCEMWLDNCLRHTRFWLMHDYGLCYQHGGGLIDITQVPNILMPWGTNAILGSALGGQPQTIPEWRRMAVRRAAEVPAGSRVTARMVQQIKQRGEVPIKRFSREIGGNTRTLVIIW